MSRKYKFIDLFAGCGGLEDGFLQSKRYRDIAAVEWLKPQVDTLIHRLETKWKIKSAKQRVLHFDIQREDELFYGWKDEVYGQNKGLDYHVNKAKGIDVIIGGPPCQAYSVAGRVRDENGMKDDYRNYLFEHYLSVVDRYKPKVFVFENVPGILSAIPDGTPITKLIRDGFNGIGYEIVDNIKKYAKIDASDYGVPQSRNRIIILGIRRGIVDDPQELLHKYYAEILPKYKVKVKKTVADAIGDLPPIYPTFDEEKHKNKEAYTIPNTHITWHESRYHSIRDMKIFGMLAEDIESGRNEYTNSKALSRLYEEKVGSKSPIHRYHVLRKDEPSTTIIAHLYKDGNRFIHYDPKQCRTITPREAARLQSFDDDFEFIGSRGDAYQMIGNAVPPLLAKKISLALADLLDNI
ncbi:DNA cytosine methyltransferase [Anaerocolumna aminovalerica]|uniref:DNA cytosine methyltransferase n=1 Tax=Anaerocolumna aminovalerica TaxID=1527 RepID=UPI000BE47741|nr:DNA cytosine methyltransferase [Anaerocolumna aminovalerica]